MCEICSVTQAVQATQTCGVPFIMMVLQNFWFKVVGLRRSMRRTWSN